MGKSHGEGRGQGQVPYFIAAKSLLLDKIGDSLLELVATIPEAVHKELLEPFGKGHWQIHDCTPVLQISCC